MTSTWRTRIANERGVALVTVMMVAFVIGALSVGAAMIASNASLINKYTDRQVLLESVADAGIELGRATVNGNNSLYPTSGYAILEDRVQPTDASGAAIPNVYRTTYVGPTGITSGQYGVFGSVVVVAEDSYGNRVIRRGEIVQESFAKFAYFTDIEPSNISFGGGDQIFGPVHSNSDIKIYASGATFWGTVRTAGIVPTPGYGTFAQGYTERVGRIEMPQTADLNRLRVQAQTGGTAFISTTGAFGEASTRVEFVAVDVDGDGQRTSEGEGYLRVYQSADRNWVTGDVPADYGANRLRNSQQCGHFDAGVFRTAAVHGNGGGDSWTNALISGSRRCFLGGAPEITNGFVANDGTGAWLARVGPVYGPLAVLNRPDSNYLYPINRVANPSFKGVVFIDGDVVISGTLRGQVTLAATGDIIIGDDVTYVTDPGAGTCADVLGIFAGGNVIMGDNTINAPTSPASGFDYMTFDDTKDEFIHGVVLALGVFTVENYNSGSGNDEACGASVWGRGCIFLTGGIIQNQRGAVGTGAGTGNLKRYSYDVCAATNPPPYFPTTGRFSRGRYYEIDPTNFSVAQLYADLTPS